VSRHRSPFKTLFLPVQCSPFHRIATVDYATGPTDGEEGCHHFGAIGSHGFVTVLLLFVGVLVDTLQAQNGAGVQGGMGSGMNSHLICQIIVTPMFFEFLVQSWIYFWKVQFLQIKIEPRSLMSAGIHYSVVVQPKTSAQKCCSAFLFVSLGVWDSNTVVWQSIGLLRPQFWSPFLNKFPLADFFPSLEIFLILCFFFEGGNPGRLRVDTFWSEESQRLLPLD